MARLSPLDAGPESRAKRAGARLAHGPVLATHRGAEALEPATATRSEETVHSASRRAGEPSTEPSREPSGPRSPEAAPPPVAVSEPAPPAETVAGSTGGLEVDADPDGVGDTLSGLSPEDFRDALDAGGGVEVRADAGALRTDLDADLAPAAGGGEASARVAAPGASTELGASASLGPGTALDAGAALAAGPAGAGVGVRAGPGQLGAVVNASGTPRRRRPLGAVGWRRSRRLDGRARLRRSRQPAPRRSPPGAAPALAAAPGPPGQSTRCTRRNSSTTGQGRRQSLWPQGRR